MTTLLQAWRWLCREFVWRCVRVIFWLALFNATIAFLSPNHDYFRTFLPSSAILMLAFFWIRLVTIVGTKRPTSGKIKP